MAHFPTLMLAIGYPIYWAEMLSGRSSTGVTSLTATVLFLIFALFVIVREQTFLKNSVKGCWTWFYSLNGIDRFLWGIICVLILGILLVACFASTRPIHLQQEGDALNYHYSLTRQHLILGSFAHIPWSAFDLFLLPVDFAMAPYWFATEFPNKVPQFIFFVGLILVMMNLLRYWQKGITSSVILVVALFFGSHGHGIQFGTAMLDLASTYLFLAMIDSLVHRVRWLFIIEACFYMWSKPFVPLQSILAVGCLVTIILIFKRLGFKEILFDFKHPLDRNFITSSLNFLKSSLGGLGLLSIAVAGPFVGKSLYYAGTPLFPFMPGLFKFHHITDGSTAWISLLSMSQYAMEFVRNTYGYGRSLTDFICHFWLLAVPSQGVNNAFDYPLGLSYLVSLGPFLFLFIKLLIDRKLPLFPFMAVILWLIWFAGSQQTRWLYVPVLIMFLSVSASIVKPSRILLGILLLAVFFNFVSILRASRPDLVKPYQNRLREKDQELVEISRKYIQSQQKGYVLREDPEVAYAQFPVMIQKESIPNVIAF